MRRNQVSRAVQPWWARDNLRFHRRQLCLGSQRLSDLVRKTGTPLYVYDGARVLENLGRLRAALQAAGLPFRVFYAMKSNRHPPLLGLLRRAGACGIDTCSPAEVERARDCGFDASEISFTGTSLSDADLHLLLSHEGLVLNLDSIHDLVRVGRLAPGRRVGLRINPGLGIGYRRNALLRYAGGRGTKFGIYPDQFPAALAAARHGGLVVEGLHFHTGCGYLTPQLGVLDRIFAACGQFIAQAPKLRYVNIGGGLGIPLVADDQPLDLAAWSRLVARRFGGGGFEVWCEPGDYLVKDAGVLVLEVNTVERKGRTLFAGVNGGFQLHPEPAFYQLPLVPVPCRQPDPRARLQPTTIAGHINEAGDLLHVDAPLPPLANGDLIAFLNAGGYGAAMASNHCLRGTFTELLLEPTLPRKTRSLPLVPVIESIRREIGVRSLPTLPPVEELNVLTRAARDPAQLKRWIKRRLAGEPIAHITGTFSFRGLEFSIDKRAYVTDPELTHLVDAIIAQATRIRTDLGRPPLIAEVGVGCGSLALAIKQSVPFARLIGIDLDADALAVAARNAERLKLELRLIESDLFDSWPTDLAEPDLIYADPPWGDAKTLYDPAERPAGHYHAMPPASAFPLGGRTGGHRQILRAVAARGWSAQIFLNGGVLPPRELAGVARSSAWHEILIRPKGIALLHCRMR